MATSTSEASQLKTALRQRAVALGFQVPRVTSAEVPGSRQRGLRNALAQGHHGTMRWLERTRTRREQPAAMWPPARTAIVLALDYGPDGDPLANLTRGDRGTISVHAQGDDYHELLKGRLKQLAGWFASAVGGDVRVFVDTAPLMEKPLAERAGLGWQGKHTNLVSRASGSWTFLGVILTDASLPPDPPESDHCGRCQRCLDVCPTDAFPAPYRLDARRCISYLTIEHAGPIPHRLRRPLGNRIYGCDDCLAVCPWNKFAKSGAEARLHARAALRSPRLEDLAALDDTGFRTLFRRSPIKRIGRDRLLRNVLIALGNARGPFAAIAPHLDDPHPVVRGAAVWALGETLEPAAAQAIAEQRATNEPVLAVRREWWLLRRGASGGAP
ncbi:MAG: tRNA epoxyqueuosine(34) reductase QueG [Pseudomonadota bacterium]